MWASRISSGTFSLSCSFTSAVNANVIASTSSVGAAASSACSSFPQSCSSLASLRQELFQLSISKTRLSQCNLRKEGCLTLVVPCAAANAEKIETPAAPSETQDAKLKSAEKIETPAVSESADAKHLRRAADWKKVETMKETGVIHRGRVDACNSGGLLVRIGYLQGFLPFSQLNGARLPKDGSKTLAEIGKELVGGIVSVKVMEVVEADKRLIVSEKQALLAERIQQMQEGTIYKGIVNCVTDYGAFVDLEFPDGSYPLSGLVHVTELSWDPVPFPKDFIAQGQEVSVKVIQIDREKLKIALSIKQLQGDPLLETLDTLMPKQEDDPKAETINSEAELIGTSLPGLEQICEYMLKEEGISGVVLGRQALERRVVSQDLEIWLSNTSVEDGRFTLLARAGRQVQEVYLSSNLDREGIKAALQRVTSRVP